MARPLIFAAGGRADTDYTIERSLIFDGAASISRTPGSAGNRKALTVAVNYKRAKLGTTQYVFSCGASANDYFAVFWDASDRLNIIRVIGGVTDAQKISSKVFRDPSAHGSLTVVLDAANTSLRAFSSGDEITAWSTDNDPSNIDGPENNTVQHTWGARSYSPAGTYFEGILSEPRILDGVAPGDDSGFVRQNPTTGLPEPRLYLGSYGAQGSRLLLDNNASTVTLGEDASGNGHNFTLTGFTLDDSVEDTPPHNFATLNPLVATGVANSFSEANLVGLTSTAGRPSIPATIAMPDGSGAYYFEGTISASGGMIGVMRADAPGNTDAYHGDYTWGVYQHTIIHNSSNVAALSGSASYPQSYGFHFDTNTHTLTIYQGGISVGSVVVDSGFDYMPFIGDGSGALQAAMTMNFGQKPFAHTPPAGFQALSSANLENPGDASPLTGTFTGNAGTDGPFVYLGYPPDTAGVCTINGNAITWGTHADALANGFKLRTSSSSYNASGSNSYSITIDPDASFADNANAQVN